MKCPHCGAPMQDEQIFCEKCGKDRQLVPVFDAQMDATLETTISGIVDDLANTREIVPLSLNPESETEKKTEKKTEIKTEIKTEKTGQHSKGKHAKKSDGGTGRGTHGSLLLIIGGILAVVLVVVIVSAFLYLRNHSSYEYQLEKAEEMYEIQNYEQMLSYAKSAVNLAPNSSDAKMMMARAYAGMGEASAQQYMLENLLADDSAYAPAYDMLIPIYEKNGNYEAAGKLLLNCKEQTILDKYVDYLISPPQPSEEEGSYDEVISLKLLAPGSGDIYYTLDGSTPHVQNGRRYTTPLILDSGHYTIRAVYVNPYHVTSEEMVAEYNVDAATIGAPLVSLESGQYTSPQMISVSIPDESCQVYYTTDGTEPSLESSLYTEPIPLPLGKSTFSFILYDEGDTPALQSEVAVMQYELEMEVSLTGEQAKNLLLQALISSGYISDTDGHIADMEGTRQYEPVTVITENDAYYYLLDEIFVSPEGVAQKTGNRFAIHTATGESFRASENAEGLFTLAKIQ